MPKRLSVKDLRASMGLSRGQMADRIWGKHKTAEEKAHHRRTIMRWEQGTHDPQSLHRQKLEEIRTEHEQAQKGQQGGAASVGEVPAPSGPQRHKATHLPSGGEKPARTAAPAERPPPSHSFLPSMS